MDRKQIPITNDFYINSIGEIYDSLGKKKNIYTNGDGYKTVNIKLKDGRWVTFGVHRLVALTFIPNQNTTRTEVNHRDTDITNNSVLNLEWVTPSENNIHSEIMRQNNEFVTIYSTRNNIPVKSYLNAITASIDNGCNVLDVWDSIKDKIEINGIVFHFRPHKGRIPELLKQDRTKNYQNVLKNGPRKIKVLDIDTGDVLEFGSIGLTAKYFNTTPSHIYDSIPKNTYPKVFLKKYQISYSDKDFPILSNEEYIRAKTHGRKKVIAFNTDKKQFYMYESATDFVMTNQLSKKIVTTNLKKNRIKQVANWIALYQNPENVVKLKSYISSPVDM